MGFLCNLAERCKSMKHLLVLLVTALLTGCYADSPYDARGPAVYAGPVVYSAYPCEWGTCYYDGVRLVFYERAPVRAYYGGVSVHYYETSYVGRQSYVAGGPVVRRGPSYAPELRAREAAQPVQREAAQPVQREAAQPVQSRTVQPTPREHARLAQQEASRRAQRQPEPQRRGQ